MKISLGLMVLVGMTVAVVPARQLRADEAAGQVGSDDEQLRAVKEQIEQSIDWYDVLPESHAETGLRPKAVLRWQNAERINTGAALLAIWTDQGRPEAMASIIQNGSNICHEFGSLSRSKKIVVRDKASVLWSPGKAGVEFHDLPDAPVPADDRVGRLRQMRLLSGRDCLRMRPATANPRCCDCSPSTCIAMSSRTGRKRVPCFATARCSHS